MLGENIRNLRKENKISQEELAERLSVSRQSISLWENGQTQPTIENIVAIADVFGVSTDDIIKTKTTAENDNVTVNEVAAETTPNKENYSKSNHTYFWIVISLVIIALVTFFIYKGISSKGMSSEEIYTLAMPTTVEIQVETDEGTKIGTGFFDDNEGTIITNYHVLKDAQEGVAVLKNVGKFDIEKVIGYDEDLDIAIIKIDYKNEKVLEKRTKQIKVGETVYALGSSEGLTNSFSSGIISSLDRVIDGNHYIQVTAPISHGNSGGPLIDEFGKVVGITSAGIEDGQNLNLVIPISAIELIERDEYWGDLKRLYNATRLNPKSYEQIKAEVMSGKSGTIYFCIDFGKYEGTVHTRGCDLVKKTLDSWIFNQNTKGKFTEVFKVQDALDMGYVISPECNCVK